MEKIRQESELTQVALASNNSQATPLQPSTPLTGIPITITPTETASDAKLLLQYDGLYQSEKEDYSDSISFFHYLRFYDDGTVLSISDLASPEKIAIWFNKSKSPGSGQYETQGSTIKFTISSLYGDVDYIGQVVENGLILESFSHINNNKSLILFHFVKIPNIVP